MIYSQCPDKVTELIVYRTAIRDDIQKPLIYLLELSHSHRMTTATTTTLDELVRSMHEQVALLTAASEIEATGQADPRDEIARQHLCRAAELVRGAAVLGAIQNAACLGILGRCLLEQLINALWAIRSLENAQTHQNTAKTELAKALKINLKAGSKTGIQEKMLRRSS